MSLLPWPSANWKSNWNASKIRLPYICRAGVTTVNFINSESRVQKIVGGQRGTNPVEMEGSSVRIIHVVVDLLHSILSGKRISCYHELIVMSVSVEHLSNRVLESLHNLKEVPWPSFETVIVTRRNMRDDVDLNALWSIWNSTICVNCETRHQADTHEFSFFLRVHQFLNQPFQCCVRVHFVDVEVTEKALQGRE